MDRIPKVIHYCWFGQGEKPKLAKRCIKSWKKRCPDYKIIEWNENNYDVASSPLFVRQALEAKQYAFATDYIRLDVVYNYGGIYLDTDVELLKNLDPLLGNHCYFGFEKHSLDISTGHGFGSEKGAPILAEIMECYESIPFIRDDGSYDRTVAGTRERNIFLRNGLVSDGSEQFLRDLTHIYPSEFFCPRSFKSFIPKKTDNSFSIHHYAATWCNRQERVEAANRRLKSDLDLLVHAPNLLAMKILGMENYNRVKENFTFVGIRKFQSFLSRLIWKG